MGAKMSAGDKVMPRKIDELSQTYGPRRLESNEGVKQRSVTDVLFLIVLIVFLTFLCGLLVYCMCNGDIYRIINGYDNCGNVCGKKNSLLVKDELCKNINTEDKPFQIVIKRSNELLAADRKCVSNCSDYSGYRTIFHRCVLTVPTKEGESFLSKIGFTNFFTEIAEDFHSCWLELIFLGIISLVLSIFLLVLFRFFVGIVVWLVLLGVLVACLIGTVILWVMWSESKKDIPEHKLLAVDARKSTTYFAFAITTTVMSILILLIIIIMRKRIKLVVQLFKEAGKALSAMPLLFLQPLWTFFSLLLVIFLWFYFLLWVESAGFLTEYQHTYRYQKDGWITYTRWHNLLAMLWMVQFIIGCQHMVIAGAISDWYFKRNKNNLGNPILKSALTLIRYHLGSVALGSFVIALVQYIRIVLKTIEKYLKNREGSCVSFILKCCKCCLYCFENILKYLTRNAYIEIAMYGYSFCRAGQQAFKILVSNALRVTAINSVGDFVLFLGKILVVVCTVLIGSKMLHNKEELRHIWVPLTLAGIFSYFVSHCFMTVYEMAIDTIFLCFCEDCEQNDGITKPYYMSRGLMEFVENSKKALEMYENKSEKTGNAWNHNTSIPTISGNLNKQ